MGLPTQDTETGGLPMLAWTWEMCPPEWKSLADGGDEEPMSVLLFHPPFAAMMMSLGEAQLQAMVGPTLESAIIATEKREVKVRFEMEAGPSGETVVFVYEKVG